METLADLKRKLQIGQGLKLIGYKIKFESNDKRLNVVRYVVKTQGNGVYLNADKTANKGSFLELPKSSLMEMDKKGFKIFEPGHRDLNTEEQKIKDNEPRDSKQEEIDALGDGSVMFWRTKKYYSDHNAEYLFCGNSKTIRGLYLNCNTNKIRDDTLKGDLILEYEFID